ncbi:uncharacterized protein FIBRA_04036 [Fibroporia radiculosa]|uniref:Uncharacterized protein n=1 Tax=Fibroporia radiculosa TaxID=599839 RepID=J4G6R4_9APHY|nr:uncharacterized protein FIBRA_04036 [Fibroporia radiculosa]CCM01963.1 predicted protein [Fibroporia radiculosa]
MSPSPLSPGVVYVVLQYIAPPSQLTQPLPPHLLSKSLLQRHHFLQLLPDNPVDYLCWPSSEDQRGRVIELLENLPRPLDDDEPATYLVQYVSDDEQTYAHVGLSPGSEDGVRLVFEWDEDNGWKYHDTALMPFPLGSRANLQDATMSERSNHDSERILPMVHLIDHEYDHDGLDGSDDDDDYWNAYGSQDDSALFNKDLSASVKGTETGAEDAYWARYASVHGTADSTQPSPPPQPKRRLQPIYSEFVDGDTHSPGPLPVPVRSGFNDSSDDALPIPPSVIRHPNLSSRWDPASPRALAQRLAAVSARSSGSPSPVRFKEAEMVESEMGSPTVGGSSGSDEIEESLFVPFTRSGEFLVPASVDVDRGAWKASDGSTGHSETKASIELEDSATESSSEGARMDMEALRDSIRGIWGLWRTARRGSRADESTSFEDARRIFQEVVQEVVSC